MLPKHVRYQTALHTETYSTNVGRYDARAYHTACDPMYYSNAQAADDTDMARQDTRMEADDEPQPQELDECTP